MHEFKRRIADLERPLTGACLSCEMGQLNRQRVGGDTALHRCTHTQRRTLAQVLGTLTATPGH